MAKSTNPADAGNSVITSFRYVKGYCIITLANGVSGIIGSNVDMPLATMLTLKGQQISYEHVGEHDGQPRYRLGFAL